MKRNKLYRPLDASCIFLTVALAFSACTKADVEGENGNETAPVISLNKQELTLEIGGSERLTASFEPAEYPNKAHVWASSAADIASVDETGLVKALTLGEAIITAKALDGGNTASCKVTVTTKMVHVAGVRLDCSSRTMKVNEELQLTATVSPSDASDKAVTWKSSNEGVASVNDDGLVKAVADGNAVITVTTNDGNFTAMCELKVVDESNIMSKTNFSPTDIYTDKLILISPVEGEIMGVVNICFGKEPNPTVTDNLTVAEVKGDIISLTLDGLEKGTTYYLRSYTREGAKITYNDDEISVQTIGDDFSVEEKYLSKEQYKDALGFEQYYVYLEISYSIKGNDLYLVTAKGDYADRWTLFAYDNSYSNEIYVEAGDGAFKCRRSGGLTEYEGRFEYLSFPEHYLIFTSLNTEVNYHLPPLEGKFYLW